MAENSNYFRTLPFELNQILLKGLKQRVIMWRLEDEWTDVGTPRYYYLELVIEVLHPSYNDYNMFYIRVEEGDKDKFLLLIEGDGTGDVECNSNDRLLFNKTNLGLAQYIMGTWTITRMFNRKLICDKLIEARKSTKQHRISIARLHSDQLCILMNYRTPLYVSIDGKPVDREKVVVDMPKDRKVVLTHIPTPSSYSTEPVKLDEIQTNADKLEEKGDTITLTWA